jgi:hypothetical protein
MLHIQVGSLPAFPATSPNAFLSETLTGLATIRAYGEQVRALRVFSGTLITD